MSRLLLPVALGVGSGVATKYMGRSLGADIPDIVPYVVGTATALFSGAVVYVSYIFDVLDTSTKYRGPIVRKGE